MLIISNNKLGDKSKKYYQKERLLLGYIDVKTKANYDKCFKRRCLASHIF